MKRRVVAALLVCVMLLTTFLLFALAAEAEPGAETEVVLQYAGILIDMDDDVPECVPGLLPEEIEFIYPSYQRSSGGPSRTPAKALESSYDGRNNQSPIRNQGSNGLCWSFMTYAVLEAYMISQGYSDMDFSELHMGYSTSVSSGNTKQGWDNRKNPGDGGNRIQASAYLMRGTSLSGTVDEVDDPYIKTKLAERALSISESKNQTYQVKKSFPYRKQQGDGCRS